MKNILRPLTLFILLLPGILHATATLRISSPQLKPESVIEVIFDRAVVSENQLNQPLQNTILDIKPALPGKIAWRGTNVARFIPDAPPKMGVNYTFSLVKGIKNREGNVLPAKVLKTITAEPFRVMGSNRRSQSARYTRQPIYYIYFNDEIDPNKSAGHFIFKNKDGVQVAATVRRAVWSDIKSRYYRGATWQQRFNAVKSGKKIKHPENENAPIPNAVVVTSSNPLPVGDKWYLHVLNGISNKQGTAIAPRGRNVYIGDIDPFELQSISPYVAANEPRQIHISFNSYLPEKPTQEQLASFVNITPTPENAKYRTAGKVLIVDGDFRTHDDWQVNLNQALTSRNGLVLHKTKPTSVKFKTVPSALALPAFDSGQYAHGNRKYALDTVNIASVRIRIKELKSEQIVRTMQGFRHYKGNGHNNRNIDPEHPIPYSLVDGKTIYDQTVFLDNAIDTSRELSLDWDEILPKGSTTTTFFVSVEGAPKPEARGGNRIAQSLVQLTDIGLCWKLNEKEAVIYAFSCKTGQPLPNARLQVFNEDAQASGKPVTTNADGIARIPRSDAARHLRATRGRDCYIIPFDNTLDTVALWRFPVDIDWNHISGWKRTAMMFTDRNLYRPGETVRIKGILRKFLDTDIELAPDKKAQLIITDSASRTLLDREITLSENGTFDHEFKLPEETVGRFRIKLVLAEDPAHEDESSWVADRFRVFYHSINVQEFRRNAYEITSNIPEAKPGATNVTLNLEANYYQGQAVKNGEVEWSFNATQTGFYPEKFRDYLFGDHRSYDPYYWSYYFGYGDGYMRRQKSDSTGKTKLDDNGKTSVTFELPKLDFPTALAVKVHSEVTDSRDQTLTETSRTTAHPADTYVGITRIDRLVRVGQDPALEIVAVDTKGEPRKDAVKVTAIIEREWNEAVKIRSADGKVSVKNTKKTEQVSEQEITIDPNKATTLPFTPEHAGRHTITLKGTDKDGHAFATASKLYIYGTKEYPWAVEDGMKIKLVPEKKRYNPGDTARILVMTPIEGTALVTVERAGVHREYRRILKADNPVIELPLEDIDAPNAYVSVVVIRGADASPRKHKEPVLKLGYCTLNVTNVKDRLKVALEVDGSQHRPGQNTTINGQINFADGTPAANAEVILYAEDEGTLAVAGYRNPDPMSHFHTPKPLLVNCGTSFSTFIAENPDKRNFANKGFTIGGGDDAFAAAGGGMDQLKMRTNFDPCAVWLPTIKTDADGKFSATYKNPDTLTRYRVIAVALSGKSKFGSAETDYTVDKPLMLEPTPPRYASEGDKLSPKVLVQNNSKYTGTWEISLTTSSITKAGTGSVGSSASRTITLKPGAAETVYFETVFANTGTARWVWTAKPTSIKSDDPLTPALSRDLSDQAETKFEVTYPVPLMREVKFVSLRNNGRSDLLEGLKPELLDGRGHLDIDLSNSLLLEAAGATDYLLRYPYGCLEQTTSALMPWFAVRDLKSLVPGFRGKNESQISKAIQKGADRILTMQTRDGGLSYWSGNRTAERWATAYGALGLILAREHGAEVPQLSINRLNAWMIKSLNEKIDPEAPGYSWDLETRARTLYVLALAKQPQVAMQNKLLDSANKLTPSSRAFLALAIYHSGSDKENQHASALALLKNTEPRVKNPRHYWMRYSSDAALLALAWSEIAPDSDEVDRAIRQLVSQRSPYGHWRTTWCNSWALQAMAAYARNVEKNRQPSTLQLVTAEGTKTITLDDNSPTQSIRIPLTDDVRLIASTNNKAYINVELNSKPNIAPTGAWGNKGLSIVRRYERLQADGTTAPMGQPNVGDLIKVSLDVTIPETLYYLVIEDRLPSLFETVNNEFASQSSRFRTSADNSRRIDHKELRSDRASFFINRSWRNGTRTISYLARVTTAGTATAPAAKIEGMYDPEQLALSESKTMTTLKKEAVVGE